MSNILKPQKKSGTPHALLSFPQDSSAVPAPNGSVAAPEFHPDAYSAPNSGLRNEALSTAAYAYKPVEIDNPARQIFGDSGSGEALRNLQDQTDHVKRVDTLVLLRNALELFKRNDWSGGGDLALQALHIDEKCGEAWHMLAISRDKCNDFHSAITCYETALRLLPENPAIANDLGRLAYKMGLIDLAIGFFAFFLDKCPGHSEAINNLASAYREANRLDEAVELLRTAIQANPSDAQLWNALGTIVNARGDMVNSITFYEEALRHDPNHVHARYNLGNAKGTLGDITGGLEDLKLALPLFNDPMNIHTCKISIAFASLSLGDLKNGWSWYEIRSKEDTSEAIHYAIPVPRWTKAHPLVGKRIFLSAEQGLGDEILFGSLIPDLMREIGETGHLTLGVEPRLVPLFQRSFPKALVVHHHTTKFKGHMVRLFPDIADWSNYDYWSIMGDYLARYRGDINAFPRSGPDGAYHFLTPDPERVSHWRRVLSEHSGRPKVGILWKSLIQHSRRDRYYSPFEQWSPVLGVEGIQFVNLQYGDASQELEQAKALGFDIWTPPGIDLKNDLDDLAALTLALDCIVCPANATSNIAGASGASVWLMSPGKPWTCLGTDYFPWYPSTRVFLNPSLEDWTPVMQDLRDALIERFHPENGG